MANNKGLQVRPSPAAPEDAGAEHLCLLPALEPTAHASSGAFLLPADFAHHNGDGGGGQTHTTIVA